MEKCALNFSFIRMYTANELGFMHMDSSINQDWIFFSLVTLCDFCG